MHLFISHTPPHAHTTRGRMGGRSAPAILCFALKRLVSVGACPPSHTLGGLNTHAPRFCKLLVKLHILRKRKLRIRFTLFSRKIEFARIICPSACLRTLYAEKNRTFLFRVLLQRVRYTADIGFNRLNLN